MRVLVVGGGGREHALGWGLHRSKSVSKVFFSPGNPGTARVGENWRFESDAELIAMTESERIDLVVVGPEAPLARGLADELRQRNVPVFGPSAAAARLESSKIYAKEFLQEFEIPTASFAVAETPQEIDEALTHFATPPVVKADGLAAGKGVVVPDTMHEARTAAVAMLEGLHGSAGKRILFEERLEGVEVSQLALVSLDRYQLLETARDHKRLLDGDQGPNTGGMGAFSPSPDVNPDLERRIVGEVFEPTIAGLGGRNLDYRGLLYVGLMLTNEGPKVLEFNVRFGDPETQPIVMRWKDDLGRLFREVALGELDPSTPLQWDSRAAACWVLSSRGYPEAPNTGKRIAGDIFSKINDEVQVFHAGTREIGGQIETSGGRVLGVTALGESVSAATGAVAERVQKIEFDGKFHRTDIGR